MTTTAGSGGDLSALARRSGARLPPRTPGLPRDQPQAPAALQQPAKEQRRAVTSPQPLPRPRRSSGPPTSGSLQPLGRAAAAGRGSRWRGAGPGGGRGGAVESARARGRARGGGGARGGSARRSQNAVVSAPAGSAARDRVVGAGGGGPRQVGRQAMSPRSLLRLPRAPLSASRSDARMI